MKKSIIGVMLLIAGLGLGYIIGFTQEHQNLLAKLDVIHPIRDRNSAYKFIDPLLAYVIPSSEQNDEFASLRQKLSNYVETEKNNNNIQDASLFMYDLNRGRWIGVDESKKYNPASMLKVVIMVAYLKDAENNPGLLATKFAYTKELDQGLSTNPFYADSDLKAGQSYTVEELINKMIIASDNGAEFLLLHNINIDSLNYIYSALNITNPEKADGAFIISPRMYSLFFRILYSATYLSRDMSEKALQILSKTTFTDGIAAGVPGDVAISHKFGEYIISESGQIQGIELHDCGIVYAGQNPYFLCVMTKGKDIDKLKNVIRGASEIVYQNYQP